MPFKVQSGMGILGSSSLSLQINTDGFFGWWDEDGARMSHEPKIKIGEQDLTKKLIRVAYHLHVYRNVSTLKHVKGRAPRYEFSVTQIPKETDAEPDVLASWKIDFKNLHQDRRVRYVTILNLTSLYGIHQIFPGDKSPSVAVDFDAEIEPVEIDMKAPKGLQFPKEV